MSTTGKIKSIEARSAFTIVELLIVIVIIAVLAAITIVAYNGVQARAVKTALQSDLRNAATKVALDKAEKGTYPADQSAALALFTPTAGTHYEYSTPDNGATYLMTITSDKEGIPAYCQKSDGSLTEGACPGHSGPSGGGGGGPIAIQTVTSANCPTSRTLTFDKRDNRTYWVQKLADGKCWMLTNLAYAGGGDNTYSDVKTINYATSGTTYTSPNYYTHASANFTTSPAEPSISTDGGVTGAQFGYHYNWCAAMGAQTGTSACNNAASPLPNAAVSICAAGWRLPTGGTSSEFSALNAAINGGSTTSDAGFRTNWLGQYGGSWTGSYSSQGTLGYYWAGNQYSATSGRAIYFNSSNVWDTTGGAVKTGGYSVRCIAV